MHDHEGPRIEKQNRTAAVLHLCMVLVNHDVSPWIVAFDALAACLA